MQLDGRLRLHVGCGSKHWPGGFVHVDKYGEAEIEADLRELPFEASCVDEIHAIHCIEHIPRMDVDAMMNKWYRILKPGGALFIEVPCMNKIAQMIVDKEKNLRLTMLGIFGDPRDPLPGMMHGWCYTQEELTDILIQAGFSVSEAEPKFHIAKRDMRLEARKP